MCSSDLQPYTAGEQQLEEEDEEGDEFHDFPSENSSGYGTSEAERSVLDFTAEKLFKIMKEGFHGCSTDEHTSTGTRARCETC